MLYLATICLAAGFAGCGGGNTSSGQVAAINASDDNAAAISADRSDSAALASERLAVLFRGTGALGSPAGNVAAPMPAAPASMPTGPDVPVTSPITPVEAMTAPPPTPAPAPAPTPAPTPGATPPVAPPPVSPTVGSAAPAAAAPPPFPAIDLKKIPTGAQGFATDQLAPTPELPGASDGTGAFRTVCEFSHMLFDDPIVYPGQPGRSHLHAFFGNTATHAGSTQTSIASSGNSTCRGGTVNRSAYWAPAVIDTRDGSPVMPQSMIIYYKSGYSVPASSIQAIPTGLRMIAGDPAKRSAATGASKFTCIDPATGYGPATVHLSQACPVAHTVWMTTVFPQCWDGINLDSPDHKSHMTYPSGTSCPASHPIPIPEITTNVLYPVRQGSSTSHWRLSSDSYDASLPAGYSSHADWFNGWKLDASNAFVRGCTQAAKDCRAHLLGNGQQMLGVGS